MTRAALLLVLTLGCGAQVEDARAPSGMPFAIERLTQGFEGRAGEVLQVSGYTYVAVEVAPGDVRWAVSLKKEIDEGARVRVRAFGKKSGFMSKQLDRTFDVLWFGIVNTGEDQ